MTSSLVKTTVLVVGRRSVEVTYFEQWTPRGVRRYGAEVLIGPGDRVIIDSDSMFSLEVRSTGRVPATSDSRALGRPAA